MIVGMIAAPHMKVCGQSLYSSSFEEHVIVNKSLQRIDQWIPLLVRCIIRFKDSTVPVVAPTVFLVGISRLVQV
jgi:hypothetical protein